MMLRTGYRMRLFRFLLWFLSLEVELVVRFLFINLLVEPHIFLENFLQCTFTLIKKTIVKVLYVFFPVFSLFNWRNGIFLLRVKRLSLIHEWRRGLRLGFMIRLNLLNMSRLGEIEAIYTFLKGDNNFRICVHVTKIKQFYS